MVSGYRHAVSSWKNNRTQLISCFYFLLEIRTISSTNNIIKILEGGIKKIQAKGSVHERPSGPESLVLDHHEHVKMELTHSNRWAILQHFLTIFNTRCRV